MDVNFLRSLTTVLMFAAFAAIVAWVMAAHRRSGFELAASLPLLDEAETAPPGLAAKDAP